MNFFFDTSAIVEPIGRAITKEAESLLKEFGKTQGLRTLDALQLGCFSLISEKVIRLPNYLMVILYFAI